MEIKLSVKYLPGLIKNGYKKHWVASYIRKAYQGRFHCLIMGDNMYLHFDNCQNWYHRIVKDRRLLEKEVSKIKTNWQ